MQATLVRKDRAFTFSWLLKDDNEFRMIAKCCCCLARSAVETIAVVVVTVLLSLVVWLAWLAAEEEDDDVDDDVAVETPPLIRVFADAIACCRVETLRLPACTRPAMIVEVI